MAKRRNQLEENLKFIVQDIGHNCFGLEEHNDYDNDTEHRR
jgi:hypothetical protein